MEPIRVPITPRAAFNKNRPASDLIKAQVEHFQHVEAKLPAEQRVGIPTGRILTEADAAAYIRSMTRVLSGRPASQSPKLVRQRKAPKPAGGLVTKIAASSPKKLRKFAPVANKTQRKSKKKS